MRYSLVCFFVIILGLKAFASNEIGGLEWSVYPTPETTTELPEELRLEFYGVQDGKWVPSGILPDEWNEFITLKDPAGNILPIKACYTGSAVNGRVGVTINLVLSYFS